MKTPVNILFSLVFLPLLAHADMTLSSSQKSIQGGLVGNGGGTVVCRDTKHQIKSIELLDFYEARTLRDMKLDLDRIPGDWKAKAQGVIARIQAKSEFHFQLYQAWLDRFESNRKLLEGVEFSTVPDSGYIGVPKGCQFEQAALQRKPIFSGDARYYLNAELWTAMDETQRAGLVLHEIIYREALAYGQEDSIRSRYLTGLYASQDFADLKQINYWKVLEQAHFETTDVAAGDEFKNAVVTTLDTRRLWQLGSDETPPTAMKLEGRYLVEVGLCSGVSCNQFESRNLGTSPPAGAFSEGFVLSKDVEHLRVGNTTIGIPNLSVPAESMPKGSLGGHLRFYPSLEGPGSYPSLSFSNEVDHEPFFVASSKWLTQSAEFFSLKKGGDGEWAWHDLLTKDLEKTSDLPPDGSLGVFNQFLASNQKCLLAQVVFFNDEVQRVSAQLAHLGCDINGRPPLLQVQVPFKNGKAFVALRNASETIQFDPNHPGHPVGALPERFSSWEGPNVRVSGQTPLLRPHYTDDLTVTELEVIDENARTDFSCGPSEANDGGIASFCGNGLVSRAVEIIDLYPNGNFKKLTAALGGNFYRSPNTVSFPAGAIVYFNEQGVPTEIH